MKFPFLSAVVGTSFRPTVAATAAAGQQVVARPEPENPADPHAVCVELNGEQLGYLPRALAARLDGGPWAGEIVEVFGSDRLGIRVRILGPAAEHPTEVNSRPARRYQISNPPTVPSSQTHKGAQTSTASLPRLDSNGQPVVVLDDNEIVRARSGRLLGTFVSNVDGRVNVRTDDGREVSYPENLIVRERRIN